MSWLYEKRVVRSEKNGTIVCRRTLGHWGAYIGSTHESSRAMSAMWRNGLRRVPECAPVKRVLMLGLALGGNLAPLHERFPGCHVTAVEWDPEMIRLWRELGPKGLPEPTVIEGDAAEAVKGLTEPFDLVMVDLFVGAEVGTPATLSSFYDDLKRLVRPTGFLIVNYYRQPALMRLLDGRFSNVQSWRWDFNTLALAQPPLPEGYRFFRGVSEYQQREAAGSKRWQVTERPYGSTIRWGVGPLRFEAGWGDDEPVPDPDGCRRLVLWQPTQRRDVPAGWWPNPFVAQTRLTGFVQLADDYAARWTAHAKRHLARWKKQQEWEIIDVEMEPFLQAYARSDIRRGMRSLYLYMIPKRREHHGERLRFFAVVPKGASGPIAGGFVALDVPEAGVSVHIASFVDKKASRASAAVGLVDYWFKYGLAKGLRFMEFDLFWAPGDPVSWKGFSRFKAQFGTTLVPRARVLTRWVGGKKRAAS